MPLNTSTTYHAPPPPCQHTYRKNVYRDEWVILSHICWGPGGPLPFSRPQTPPPRPSPPPPPPPTLKLAGKWEGVGVWPVATSPPCSRGYSVSFRGFSVFVRCSVSALPLVRLVVTH